MTAALGDPAAAVHRHPFGAWRWLCLGWLAVYLPVYTQAYGARNFLFLCNLGVILTAVGVLAGSRLVVSSQALAAPVIGLVWALDAGFRLLTGDFLFGGTAYMWDPQYPLHARILSLYHLVWPPLVVAAVARVGYDRRAWPLQTAIAAATLVVVRVLTPPEDNVNFAFRDPFWDSQIGPPPLHLLATTAALGVVIYGIPHFFLGRSYGLEKRRL